jgi:uncharacterized protein involved in cysteine biosynthesis
MPQSFSLILSHLSDPAVRRVLLKSLALTLVLFLAAAALAGWMLTGTNPCGLGPLDYECTVGPETGTFAAILFGLLGLWFLFPAIAIGVIGFFADEVVEAVERRHYPLAGGRNLPLGRSLEMGLRSAGRLVLWNLLAVPFYILLLFTGIGPFLLFFAINAVALGRDLGEMVAARHLEGEALPRWLAATRLTRAALGFLATWLFVIPFANLLAPVLGAIAATHLFHRTRGRG